MVDIVLQFEDFRRTSSDYVFNDGHGNHSYWAILLDHFYEVDDIGKGCEVNSSIESNIFLVG